MLFQIGWLIIVIGSQSYIYLAILPLLVFYLWLEKRWHKVSIKQYMLRLLIALLGFAFDSLIANFGLISFSGEKLLGFMLAPLWLALLWVWFMATFANCYNWLLGKKYIAIIFAALFGPVAYWGATHLTSLTILEPIGFTLSSITFWSVLFAAIFAQDSWSRLLIHKKVS